jgi:hypothetical protein
VSEQVLTTGQVAEAGKGFSGQEVAPVSAPTGKGAGLIDVKHRSASAPPTRRRKRRRKGRAKRRKGGWKTTKCISHALRKDTKRKARLLLYEGYDFTDFATARGLPGQSDAKSKRHVTLMFARLGQKMERAGYLCVGLVTFEKHNGLLHGHMSVHAPGNGRAVVRAWADRYDDEPVQPYEYIEGVGKHARPFVPSDIDYQTKQHHFCGPFERRANRFWQEGEPFAGTRVAWTKGARAITERAEARHCQVVESEPVEVVNTEIVEVDAAPHEPGPLRVMVNTQVAEVRDTLFDDLPVIAPPERSRTPRRREKIAPPSLPLDYAPTVIDMLHELRCRHTCAEIGERIGLSRQQANNADVSRFGMSRERVRRVLELARAA